MEPGRYHLLIGRSAEDLPLEVSLEVGGEKSPARRRGTWTRAELFHESVNTALVPETRLHGTAVSVADPSLVQAALTYRSWEGPAPASVSVRVVRSGGGVLSVQLPGAAGTWRNRGTAVVRDGFTGDVEIPLAGGESSTMPAAVRLVLEGAVTVSELLIP